MATLRSHDLNVPRPFVIGSDSNTVQSTRNNIAFPIEEDRAFVAVYSLSSYPGHNAATIPINRFFVPNLGRMNGTSVIFVPNNMKPSTLQREINDACKKFYGHKQILRRIPHGQFWAALRRAANYCRVWEIRKSTSKWADYPATVEGKHYGANERLGEGIHPAQFLASSQDAGIDDAVTGR